MIYSLKGDLKLRTPGFVILDVNGVGYKLSVNSRTLERLPSDTRDVLLFCHLHLPDGAMDLYGFLTVEELEFFELLISISGVGPKSALSLLDTADIRELQTAIVRGRSDLLSKAAGIGQKTAARIILELKSKMQAEQSETAVLNMESDADILESLVSLGYRRDEARATLRAVGDGVTGLEARLKSALKLLGPKHKK